MRHACMAVKRAVDAVRRSLLRIVESVLTHSNAFMKYRFTLAKLHRTRRSNVIYTHFDVRAIGRVESPLTDLE
jgi:hypothetical protein